MLLFFILQFTIYYLLAENDYLLEIYYFLIMYLHFTFYNFF